MEIRHLELLRELRDRGSLAAVAAATLRTPSALSQQLRQAQREAGTPLVEPHGRGLRLTPAGNLLADGAQEVLASIERVQAQLDHYTDAVTGTVTLAGLPSGLEILAPPLIAAMKEIEVEVLDIDLRERDFGALAAEYDIVIGHSLTAPIPEGAEHLDCLVLAREPMVIALPEGHPLGRHERLRPQDVVDQPWVGVPDGFPFENVLIAIEAHTGTTLTRVQRVKDNALVRRLVGAGVGLALLPAFSTPAGEGIILRPLVGVPAARWLTAISRPDRAQRAAVARVRAELARIGAELESGADARA